MECVTYGVKPSKGTLCVELKDRAKLAGVSRRGTKIGRPKAIDVV